MNVGKPLRELDVEWEDAPQQQPQTVPAEPEAVPV